MLSAGRGMGALCGETEGSRDVDWVGMLGDRRGPGGVKRGLFTVSVAACLAGFASGKLGPPCRGMFAGLRSPELFGSISDTVASITRRSDANGLLPPPDPLRVLR